MASTIYIAPGTNRCNVYLIPYPMRPGQNPRDIAYEYQKDWKQVALLNRKLEIVWIAPEVRRHKDEIAGQMGGTYFEVDNA